MFFYYYESSLGSWSTDVYCENVEFSEPKAPNESLCKLGVIYTILFLLVNLVLILNLVIALLSSIFAFYEDKTLGLYYEVIVALFPSMEYDDKYGSIVCAIPPFNMLILPFQWLSVLPLNESFLINYNKFQCHILYIAQALMFTTGFSICNIIYVPITYVQHTLSLIKTLTDADETMDELEEKIERAKTIVKFIFFGFFYLLLSVPVDGFVFFYNLYTFPQS